MVFHGGRMAFPHCIKNELYKSEKWEILRKLFFDAYSSNIRFCVVMELLSPSSMSSRLRRVYNAVIRGWFDCLVIVFMEYSF